MFFFVKILIVFVIVFYTYGHIDSLKNDLKENPEIINFTKKTREMIVNFKLWKAKGVLGFSKALIYDTISITDKTVSINLILYYHITSNLRYMVEEK